MADVSVLKVQLYGEDIGTLTLVQGDQTIFTFDRPYVEDMERPALSLSFKDRLGGLIDEVRPTNMRVHSFFSNLLPEGPMRTYLAKQAGVNEKREFFLLWVLGLDLPGAITIKAADGGTLPPDVESEIEAANEKRRRNILRFSLAGVQLKFSALSNGQKRGGFVIPAEGIGGSWIVKLPSMQFEGVPENEFSMMSLARQIGMDVPEVKLVEPRDIEGLPEGIGNLKRPALAVERFDRSDAGPVHIEDFAQVFGIWPEKKYDRGSALSIANVLGGETGSHSISEFIRRLIFNTIIGNADMHLKNWSLIYPDRRHAALAPAYDFLSTIPYIKDDEAAIKYARTKKMARLSFDELRYLAGKAQISETLVIKAARETIEHFRDAWPAAKKDLPIADDVASAIEAHMSRLLILGSNT